MQFKYKETKIKLRQKEYTICIPDYEFKDLYANPRSNGVASALIVASKDDMNALFKAFYYYSESDNTILYIRRNTSLLSALSYNIPSRDKCVDIVLLNHKMQFKNKVWKEIRTKLKNRRHILKQSDIKINDIDSASYWRYGFRENKDHLDISINYSTLFLTGSKRVFASLGKNCLDLSGEDYWKCSPHFHAEYMIRENKKERSYNNDLIFYLFDPEWE